MTTCTSSHCSWLSFKYGDEMGMKWKKRILSTGLSLSLQSKENYCSTFVGSFHFNYKYSCLRAVQPFLLYDCFIRFKWFFLCVRSYTNTHAHHYTVRNNEYVICVHSTRIHGTNKTKPSKYTTIVTKIKATKKNYRHKHTQTHQSNKLVRLILMRT